MMIAVLDILQSIPVLSFLPGVMLAMIALIPHPPARRRTGLHPADFTGQVWNMAFSFYSSLKSHSARAARSRRHLPLRRWQRFFQLELPFRAIGLVWNSMVSVAGGWFTLMACEMFSSATATSACPASAPTCRPPPTTATPRHAWGIVTMVAIIVAIDQLIWRPLIAWSRQIQVRAGGKRRSTRARHPRNCCTHSTALRIAARHA